MVCKPFFIPFVSVVLTWSWADTSPVRGIRMAMCQKGLKS